MASQAAAECGIRNDQKDNLRLWSLKQKPIVEYRNEIYVSTYIAGMNLNEMHPNNLVFGREKFAANRIWIKTRH